MKNKKTNKSGIDTLVRQNKKYNSVDELIRESLQSKESQEAGRVIEHMTNPDSISEQLKAIPKPNPDFLESWMDEGPITEKIKIAAQPEPGTRGDSHLHPVIQYLISTSHKYAEGGFLTNQKSHYDLSIAGKRLDVDDLHKRFDFPENVEISPYGIMDRKNAIIVSLSLEKSPEEEADYRKRSREFVENYHKTQGNHEREN